MPENEDPIILNKDEFPGNSQKAKPEKPKAKKLVTAKRVKKPLHKRFVAAFMEGGAANEVGDYVVHDVIIPAAKSTIADLIEGAIDLILFGGAGRGGRARSSYLSRDRGRTYVSYNTMHGGNVNVPGNRARGSRQLAEQPRNVRSDDVSEIMFDNRNEAELVLGELAATVSKYGAASVADFFEMSDQTAPYTAQRWGWTDISGSAIVRGRSGWYIQLPDPEPLP